MRASSVDSKLVLYFSRSDPRLSEMLAKVNIYANKDAGAVNVECFDKKTIDRKEFKNLIIENIVLIAR